MARRQSEVLRNLDDVLRVFHLLTMRSCGLVLMFYSLCYAAELVLHVFSLAFGTLGPVMQFVATAACAMGLSWVEKHEDEHYVPSAIRYWLGRPWRVLYAGGKAERTTVDRHLLEVLRGR
jgi:hypothetical protein